MNTDRWSTRLKIMNHRRALILSTNAGLLIFATVIVGVVIWTTDEMLGWNLLPLWMDEYARLMVIIMALLAGFSVVISAMCSLAVMADAAAERAGLRAPAPLGRAKIGVAVGLASMLGVMFLLHQYDRYRAHHRAAAMRAQLAERVPGIVDLFSAEVAGALGCDASHPSDEAVAQLLRAIETSTPFRPQVSLLLPANAPYTYCILTALPSPSRRFQTDDWTYVSREFLTGFPSDREAEVVRSAFAGQTGRRAPDGLRGVFVDTTTPSEWGPIRWQGKVVGLLMLRGFLPG